MDELINPFTHEYWMKIAYAEAEKALKLDEVPVGAVIVKDNQIIAKAHNQVETLKDPTAHAEMIAITSASNFLGSKYLLDCTLYVTLEPCVMCAGAAFWTRISRLVYGAADEKRGYSLIGQHLLHPKTLVTTGVLQQDCKTILKTFFETKRD